MKWIYELIPLALGKAPAFVRADVVSSGKWVRFTEAVMVRGRSASSLSLSGIAVAVAGDGESGAAGRWGSRDGESILESCFFV